MNDNTILLENAENGNPPATAIPEAAADLLGAATAQAEQLDAILQQPDQPDMDDIRQQFTELIDGKDMPEGARRAAMDLIDDFMRDAQAMLEHRAALLAWCNDPNRAPDVRYWLTINEAMTMLHLREWLTLELANADRGDAWRINPVELLALQDHLAAAFPSYDRIRRRAIDPYADNRHNFTLTADDAEDIGAQAGGEVCFSRDSNYAPGQFAAILSRGNEGLAAHDLRDVQAYPCNSGEYLGYVTAYHPPMQDGQPDRLTSELPAEILHFADDRE